MSDDESAKTLSVQIANQIVNVANARLEDGAEAAQIAAGLRHAAANFSAFALYQSEADPNDAQRAVEEFIQFFEYYLERHAPTDKPQGGLYQLVEEAKNEI
ncbi:MAG: DUF3144 domain-containing protein [Rhodospirillales bacterium]|nr:DUF3144 domain-containing protein [Rhodospirillales bacterium]